MKISDKMAHALNAQVQLEFQSAYLYLSMAAWFEEKNFGGFAQWMRKQYNEETEHGMKMFDYIAERGGRAELDAISAPERDWKDSKAVFADTYKHEKSVTEHIYKLIDAAYAEKDYASVEFLNWFVKEQVEEEATASDILAKLELTDDCIAGILALDRQLGER